MILKYFFTGFLTSVVYFGFVPLISFIFSKLQSKKDSIRFDFKELFITTLLFSIIFGFFLWLGEKMTNNILGIILFSFLTLLVVAYRFLIDPIWLLINNKTKDFAKLPEILRIQNDFQYKQYKILVFKEPKLTNAYATGILPFASLILLGEGLIEKLNSFEIKCILFHEVGHHEKKHLIKLYIATSILSLIGYFIFYWRGIIIDYYFENDSSIHLVSVFLTGCFITSIIIYGSGLFQKKYEYEADLFAAEKVGVDKYISALITFNKISEGKLTKGGVTHPTLEKRIQYLRKNCCEN